MVLGERIYCLGSGVRFAGRGIRDEPRGEMEAENGFGLIAGRGVMD